MKGAQEDVCEKQAKAKHDQAKAGIKKQYAAREDKSRDPSATSGATSRGAAGGTTGGPAK
jgi:hypothetical protein